MELTITCASPKTGRSVSFTKDFPSNLAEAQDVFGDELVFNIFKTQAVIKTQAAVRRVLDMSDEEGNPTKTDSEAIGAGINYTPSLTKGGGSRKSPIDKLVERVNSGAISKEALLAEIKSRLKEG